MRAKGLLWAAGVGCAIGYFFDPRAGGRRRALMRDKATRIRGEASDIAGKIFRDVRNRTRGALATARSRVTPREIPDEVLHDQIRSRLGRVVSHPRAIDVTVEDGTVTLSGPILEEEVGTLLGELSTLRGIHELQDNLEVYGNGGGDPPALQGVGSPSRIHSWKRDTWPPGLRLAAGSAGGALLLASSATRSRIAKGALMGTGTALVMRSAFNLPWFRIVGVGAGRTAVDVQKSIYVNAPVEEVFELWSNFENLPNFFTNVKEVRRTERPDEYRFTVAGPAGVPVEWHARVTKLVPNELVGWKTVSDSIVKNAGQVQFRSENGGTRVDVHLKYNPGIGALGHAAAKLFGADPKSLMDEDLARMKNYLELGSGRRTGEGPREIAPD
jgi:uncharacterized membrane protein